MSLDIINEVWNSLKSYVDVNDVNDAAESIVNLMIDLGHDAEDIRETFRGDKSILSALAYFIEQHDEEPYAEDEDIDPDDPDDEW